MLHRISIVAIISRETKFFFLVSYIDLVFVSVCNGASSTNQVERKGRYS